jgi:hypothetical protein
MRIGRSVGHDAIAARGRPFDDRHIAGECPAVQGRDQQTEAPQVFGLLLDEHRQRTVDGRGRPHPFATEQDAGLGRQHLFGQGRVRDRDHVPEAQHGQGDDRPAATHELMDEWLPADAVCACVEAAEQSR